MIRARSSACWWIRWYHFIRMAPRSLAVLLRQAGQARLAAASAAWVSVAPRLATCASTAPVAGSVTANWLLPDTHSPLISAADFSRLGSASEASGEGTGMVVMA